MKKYIDDNRETFDDKEPSAGHFDRFEALLNSREKDKEEKKPKRKINLVPILSIAASVAILIGVAIKFYAPDSIKRVPAEQIEKVDEFQATNDYYNQLMEEKIADIMCKLASTDSENQVLLSRDLEQIIDYNKQFVNEMKNNENREIALLYLVKHYKTNIQALEGIDEKLGKYANC
ncbi:MAG: hypothetical protein LBV43_13535 [Prevotella sp.]|nr:hypothetical protein [Prevotella sp.]